MGLKFKTKIKTFLQERYLVRRPKAIRKLCFRTLSLDVILFSLLLSIIPTVKSDTINDSRNIYLCTRDVEECAEKNIPLDKSIDNEIEKFIVGYRDSDNHKYLRHCFVLRAKLVGTEIIANQMKQIKDNEEKINATIKKTKEKIETLKTKGKSLKKTSEKLKKLKETKKKIKNDEIRFKITDNDYWGQFEQFRYTISDERNNSIIIEKEIKERKLRFINSEINRLKKIIDDAVMASERKSVPQTLHSIRREKEKLEKTLKNDEEKAKKLKDKKEKMEKINLNLDVNKSKILKISRGNAYGYYPTGESAWCLDFKEILTKKSKGRIGAVRDEDYWLFDENKRNERTVSCTPIMEEKTVGKKMLNKGWAVLLSEMKNEAEERNFNRYVHHCCVIAIKGIRNANKILKKDDISFNLKQVNKRSFNMLGMGIPISLSDDAISDYAKGIYHLAKNLVYVIVKTLKRE